MKTQLRAICKLLIGWYLEENRAKKALEEKGVRSHSMGKEVGLR